MNYYLKQCKASDFDTLRELSIRTFYETFAHLNTPEDMKIYLEDTFNIERFSQELNNQNSTFYLLYSNERIAGYLKLNEAPSQTDINDPSGLEIERIYIISKFQGKGLGQFLIEHAVSIATERKKLYIWLV